MQPPLVPPVKANSNPNRVARIALCEMSRVSDYSGFQPLRYSRERYLLASGTLVILRLAGS